MGIEETGQAFCHAGEDCQQLSILGVYSEKMLSEVITNSCFEEGPFHMHILSKKYRENLDHDIASVEHDDVLCSPCYLHVFDIIIFYQRRRLVLLSTEFFTAVCRSM